MLFTLCTHPVNITSHLQQISVEARFIRSRLTKFTFLLITQSFQLFFAPHFSNRQFLTPYDNNLTTISHVPNIMIEFGTVRNKWGVKPPYMLAKPSSLITNLKH